MIGIFWGLCPQNVSGQCEITVSTSNANSDFVQVLVLADTNGTIIDIMNGNSATFTTPSTGSYNVHALNYDPADPPNPLPMIGGTIPQVGSVSGCFNSDNFGSDVKPIECLCNVEPITASFNAQDGYDIIYVLADASGLVLAVNSTGLFSASDGLGDDTFIHALHYEIANPPSPLPIVGGNVSDVGTATVGCFNSEFVSNPLCILLSPGSIEVPVQIIRVCDGNALFASLDGITPIDGTGITFVWSLDGNIVATIENSPYFSPNVIGDYTVTAFNELDCTTYIGNIEFEVNEIIDCQDCGQ